MVREAARAIRHSLIEALERRASTMEGPARRLLDERITALRATPEEAGDVVASERTRGPLGQLVDGMTPPAPTWPELPELEAFHLLWDAQRSETQFRQSLDHVPTDAGPLNSSALVHRSIALMQELSPPYLRHFLSYVDDLSWLEQMSAASAPAVKESPKPKAVKAPKAPKAPAAKKRTRKKT